MSLKLFLSLNGLFSMFLYTLFQKRLKGHSPESTVLAPQLIVGSIFVYLFVCFFCFFILFYFYVFIYFFFSPLCVFLLLVCFVAANFVFNFYWPILFLCAFKFVFFSLLTRRFHFVVGGVRFNLPLVRK